VAAHKSLVLASSSPYRRALLDRLRLTYTVAAPDVDESANMGEGPRATALRLAESKARAVGQGLRSELVIGADQVAVLDGQSISKPGSHEAARAQLAAMRGQRIVFHTALCLLDTANGECQLAEVPTTVQFRDYTDAEAARYLELEQPYDCAGSAKIEALGIVLVERVESADPTAIIGLPLITLVTLLKRAGTPIF
jgi:septum formation protein